MRSISRFSIVVLLAAAACARQPTQPPVPQTMQAAVVESGELSYRVVGEGEPVLLIHGSVFADAFEPLLTEPSLWRYQLIQYHRRGYQRSSRAPQAFTIQQQAADAIALLDRLGIKKAHIAGHSYGGAIALQIAKQYPERVGSLVLLEPTLFEMTPAAQAFFAEVGKILEARAKGGGDRAALEAFTRIVVGPNAWENARKGLGDAALERVVADAPTFFDVEIPATQSWQYTFDDVGKLRVPVLAVVGSESKPHFRETHANVRKSLPQSQELIVQSATHELQMTHPTVVASGVAAFLRRHPL